MEPHRLPCSNNIGADVDAVSYCVKAVYRGKACRNGIHIIESNIRCSPKDSKNFKKCLHNVHCSTTTGGKEKFKSVENGTNLASLPLPASKLPIEVSKKYFEKYFSN